LLISTAVTLVFVPALLSVMIELQQLILGTRRRDHSSDVPDSNLPRIEEDRPISGTSARDGFAMSGR